MLLFFSSYFTDDSAEPSIGDPRQVLILNECGALSAHSKLQLPCVTVHKLSMHSLNYISSVFYGSAFIVLYP